MKKSVKIGLAVVIGVPVLAAVLVPLFVDANTFRPMIESRLSTALARKVTLGNLSLSVWTGSLVANDLEIAEDPKFGQTPFFTAKRLRIGVQLAPLIFKRDVVLRSLRMDAPQIHLIRGEDGVWNYSTLGHGGGMGGGMGEGTGAESGGQPPAQSAPVADLSIGLIHIRDGKAMIETLPLEKNPQIYDHLEVRLDRFSLQKSFAFTVTALLPGDGKVGVSGTVGPVDPQDAAATKFDGNLSIQHLDPVVAGFIEPGGGISMVGGLETHVVSDGVNVTSNGKIHAEHLILLKGGRAAPHPVDVTYEITHSLKGNDGQVKDLAIHTGAVAVHIQGTYQFKANVPVVDLKLAVPTLPIDGLQELMPAAGVKLPDGATLKGGTLSANFHIEGTPKDNVITGSYDVKNTELLGYNLGSKIVGIAALGGIKTGDNLMIDESRADMRITKAGSETTNIYSVLPALGTSTGSGTVSPAGQLDFHLISKVTGLKGLNKVGVDLMTKLNSTSSAAKPSDAKGIPITITGTAANPVITADVSSLVKGNAATLMDKTGLSKLFGKKK